MECFIVFPNQLFRDTTNLKKYDKILLIEDPLYFSDKERVYRFNAIKCIYQRACFKYYEQYLKKKNFDIKYHDFDGFNGLIKKIKKDNQTKSSYTMYDPFDKLLTKRYKKALNITVIDSPHFLDTEKELKQYFKSKKNKLFQTSFYSYQRKKYNVLIKNSKPVGGKLTYDTDNRHKLPSNIKIPKFPKLKESKYVTEARKYVKKNIPYIDDIDNIDGEILFPTNHKDTFKAYSIFLKERLSNFGKYQDAMTTKDNPILFHSGNSPPFNIGFITQKEIINLVLQEYRSRKIPISSVEGLIRQILGWNSFCRAYYVNYNTDITKNFYSFKRKLNYRWYTGDTGIKIVDDTIKSAFKFGYLHHIQRLMVILNIMVLCEIDFAEQYRWHMEYSLDSYDYLMMYNVYSMGYGDGGLTTTKPYISSAAYLLRMSDYPRKNNSSEDWTYIWESLYYNFLDKHQNKFKKNSRMITMYAHYNKKTKKQLEDYKKTARIFIKKTTK